MMSNNGYDPLDMLNTEQIGKILQVKARTVRDYIKRYNLRHVKHPGGHRAPIRIYMTRGDLEEFIFTKWNK